MRSRGISMSFTAACAYTQGQQPERRAQRCGHKRSFAAPAVLRSRTSRRIGSRRITKPKRRPVASVGGSALVCRRPRLCACLIPRAHRRSTLSSQIHCSRRNAPELPDDIFATRPRSAVSPKRLAIGLARKGTAAACPGRRHLGHWSFQKRTGALFPRRRSCPYSP
jgi:hypothetical protein